MSLRQHARLGFENALELLDEFVFLLLAWAALSTQWWSLESRLQPLLQLWVAPLRAHTSLIRNNRIGFSLCSWTSYSQQGNVSAATDLMRRHKF